MKNQIKIKFIIYLIRNRIILNYMNTICFILIFAMPLQILLNGSCVKCIFFATNFIPKQQPILYKLFNVNCKFETSDWSIWIFDWSEICRNLLTLFWYYVSAISFVLFTFDCKNCFTKCILLQGEFTIQNIFITLLLIDIYVWISRNEFVLLFIIWPPTKYIGTFHIYNLIKLFDEKWIWLKFFMMKYFYSEIFFYFCHF